MSFVCSVFCVLKVHRRGNNLVELLSGIELYLTYKLRTKFRPEGGFAGHLTSLLFPLFTAACGVAGGVVFCPESGCKRSSRKGLISYPSQLWGLRSVQN
jgi:hypothetical protein